MTESETSNQSADSAGEQGDAFGARTADKDYADRLQRLQGKWWKKALNVQLPWKLHLRRLNLGRVLDVGCGRGRTLTYVDPSSVGVDHNAYSIEQARALGVHAVTADEFFASDELRRPGGFDSILGSHLIEHLTPAEAKAVIGSYLPFLKPGGRVVFFTPQERGYASDATHVTFAGFEELRSLSQELGLVFEKEYSFPFPRWMGKPFIYNEFIHISRTPEQSTS